MGKEEWRNTIKGFLQVVESREELCRKNIFLCVCLVTQSCPTLSNPADCSPPGSSVHGILQAGILEWVAMPPSRGSPLPKDGTTCLLHEQAGSLPLAPPGKTSNWLLLDQFDYMKGIDNIFREPFLRCLLFCYTEYNTYLSYCYSDYKTPTWSLFFLRFTLTQIILKVCIESVTILFLFYALFFFWPWGMWDVSSLTGD